MVCGRDVYVHVCGPVWCVYYPPHVLCRRLACLKYLVLANMLMKSGINPFDSTETKAYKGNPEVLAMTNLVRSVEVGGVCGCWVWLVGVAGG